MTNDGGATRRGSGAGGSRGRAASIIARRRPAQKASSQDSAKDAKGQKPAKAAAGASASVANAREEARPKRRRRRTAAPAAPAAPAATAATHGAAQPALAPKAKEEPAAAAPAPARTAAPSRSNGDGTADVAAMQRLVEEQRALLTEVRATLASLERRVESVGVRPRLGVFVDVPNLIYGQDVDEKPINAGKLLALLSRGRELVRATAYSPVSDDPSEPVEQQKFVQPFVPYEYRIVTKPLKRFADGSIKGNFDVEMAIDMITMADRLDIIAIVSGDADFARAVETVQARGLRVEVVAFARSTSLEMRALADHYVELSAIVEQIR